MKNITTKKLNRSLILKLAVALLALSGSVASAQFNVLHSFTGGVDGANPYYGAPVISGSTLYGTANQGAAGGGVVYSVNTDGSGFAILHTFTNAAPDGYQPLGSLALSGSTLYGTTYYGGNANGTAGVGTVFAVNTDGSGYQNLHSFTSSTGYKPYSAVIVDGSTLYGMTYYGTGTGVGSIYSLLTSGLGFTNLHTFAGGTNDGSRPLGGSLLLNNGVLYGATVHGGTGSLIGTGNDGVVFSVNPDGSGYTNLVNFTGGTTNGANPYGGLTLVGSKFYGTTRVGGTANLGTIYSLNTDGSGYSVLFNFTGGATNGANPNGALTSIGSFLVGTTKAGGSSNLGTLFKIGLDGSGFNLLHSFTGTDGSSPVGDLAYNNNTLYGWTSTGGASNAGTVFSMAVGGYAFGGLGMTNVLAGNIANGGLFWTNIPTWLNVPPSLPYTYQETITMPACNRIVASRLLMTVWGGTPDHTCQMTVAVNGTNLPTANPFVFGTTGDLNALFSSDAPCAYGSGYGVWLVAVPIPTGMLFTNGTPNTISVTEGTPDSFDGRIQYVGLTAVYQSSALTNAFAYSVAEGSGDIYSSPASGEVSQRTAVFAPVNPANATNAMLTALYTYGDTGQNDRLYFNGVQYGGDDVAQWSGPANYGPSVVTFSLTNLLAANAVTFSVSTNDVPAPQETSLRPQFAVLAVTSPSTAGQLAITGINTTGAHLIWSGPTLANYSIESTTNLSPAAWNTITNFTGTSGTMTFTDSAATNSASRFYRAKTQ
jgi:uncharacterized repeat protein (TIGR03803 family)